MGLFRKSSKKENEEFAQSPEITSSYASFEAALREELETGPNNTLSEVSFTSDGDPQTPVPNLSGLLRIVMLAGGILAVLALAWAVSVGPLSPTMRQIIARLNERAMAPITTETATASETAPAGSTPLSDETESAALPLASPTPTRTHTPAATATLAVTPTPRDTETPTPEPTPTSAVAGCVPAAAITLDDVGKELCVTAFVFSAEVFDTYFSVRTGEDFYFVSYAKGWYKDYGVTWEYEKGDCVYATGKIEQIGSFPLMQVGYKNPLERCEAP